MRIIGPASATKQRVYSNCTAQLAVQPRFLSHMFDPIWHEAEVHGLDPVGQIAQAIKETGGAAFTGKVKWEFYNPCGLKVRHVGLFPESDGDMPLAHQQFPNWRVGAMAQAQHIRAYAGWPLDSFSLIVDPRYDWVIGKHKMENWKELGGKWAPSPTYGIEIEDIMRRLQL